VVILPVVLVPLSFAYAIVQYRMMEIRRLVHRGMVYGTVFVVLLSVLGAAVGILTRTMDLGADGTYSQAVVMGLVAAGIMLFFPLHALARRLVDRLAYGGPTDYRAALGMLGRDLWAADAKAQAAAIVHHVVRVLQLESGLLVLEGAA
jgi:hypothetical protein